MTPKQKKITVFVAVVAIVLAIALFSSPLAALSSLAQALGMAFLLGLGVGVGRYCYAVFRGQRKATDDLPDHSQVVARLSDCHRWIAIGGLIAIVGVALAGGLPWWGWMTLLAAIWMAVVAAPSDIYGLPMSAYMGAALVAGAGGAALAWLAQYREPFATIASGDPQIAAAFVAGVPLMCVASAMSLMFHADRQRASAPAVVAVVPRQDPPRVVAVAPVQAPPQPSSPAHDEAARVRELRNQQRQRAEEQQRQADEQRRQAEAEKQRQNREEEARKRLLDPPPPRPSQSAQPKRPTQSSATTWSSHLPSLSSGLADACSDRLPDGEVTAAAIAEACNRAKATGPNVWVFVGPTGASKQWLVSQLGTWMDVPAQILPQAATDIPAVPLVIAPGASAAIIAKTEALLEQRVHSGNTHTGTLIVLTVDASLDADDPQGSAQHVVASRGAAMGELAEVIPVLPCTTTAHWRHLAMLMLETKAHITDRQRLADVSGEVVAYAQSLPGGMSASNLLLSINKLVIR